VSDAFTLTAGLLGRPGETVALLRVGDGRPEVLTVLPGGTFGSGESVASEPLAYWMVPTSTASRSGDVLVWREVAWRLAERCAHDHWAWAEYTEWAVTLAEEFGLDPDTTIARNEVWAAQRLSSDDLAALTGRSHLCPCVDAGFAE